MKEEFKIVHQNIAFKKRTLHWLQIYLFSIVGIFLVSIIVARSLDFKVLSVFMIASIILTLLKIYQGVNYLLDIHEHSGKVTYRFLKVDKETTGIAALDDVNIYLKNTSTRAGFKCKLFLKINDNRFVITDAFGWTLAEMSDLFRYIKEKKGEKLSHNEKSTLKRIQEAHAKSVQ